MREVNRIVIKRGESVRIRRIRRILTIEHMIMNVTHWRPERVNASSCIVGDVNGEDERVEAFHPGVPSCCDFVVGPGFPALFHLFEMGEQYLPAIRVYP